MHEYGLTKQIVAIACDAAKKENAKQVNSILLVIGENTGIIPDSIQLYFDMIAKDTVASGAMLDLRIVPTQMHCPHCNKNFLRPHFSFACPECGMLGNPTQIGNEFYVESLELEV